ncbi:MAG: hypothetical protein GXZ11_08260 [Tissierellia bacterium]|nr:hypothetical protein [Tissierellia bacterium]
MRLLLKYEFKNSKRFIFALVACIILASFLLQMTARDAMNYDYDYGKGRESIQLLTIMISMLIITGSAVSFFFFVASLLSKDVFRDRGYLTLTLPISGYEIIGAKSLCAIVWTIVTGIISVGVSLLIMPLIINWEMVSQFYDELLRPDTIEFLVYSTIYALGSCFIIYELIFTSILVSKLSISKYRLSGLWFVMFLVAFGLYQWFMNKFMPIDLFSAVFLTKEPTTSFLKMYTLSAGGTNTIVGALLLALNGYLLENKIDL